MRTATVFHPNYFYHARPTVNSTMLVRVQIKRQLDEHAEWEPGVGMTDQHFPIWEGYARIQPNIDWRARPRDFAGEFNATQAVRIQVAMEQNELGATRDADGKIVAYAPDPEDFRYGDVVEVIEAPVEGTQSLLTEVYTVRNGRISQNKWQYNLLCDTGTK